MNDKATLTVPEAAALLGCSTSAAYDAIRSGDFPTPVVRIGRKIVVPARPLLDLLGVEAAIERGDLGEPLDTAGLRASIE